MSQVFYVFLLNFIIEALVAVPLLKNDLAQRILSVLLANGLTHPTVIFVHKFVLYRWPWLTAFILLETGVIIAESIVYHFCLNLRWRSSVVVSLLANAVTASMSFIPIKYFVFWSLH